MTISLSPNDPRARVSIILWARRVSWRWSCPISWQHLSARSDCLSIKLMAQTTICPVLMCLIIFAYHHHHCLDHRALSLLWTVFKSLRSCLEDFRRQLARVLSCLTVSSMSARLWPWMMWGLLCRDDPWWWTAMLMQIVNTAGLLLPLFHYHVSVAQVYFII